jgi:leucyl-tRNA synthetase
LFNKIVDDLSDYSTCRKAIEVVLQLLNPFIPHITEELWEKAGHKERLYITKWPDYDESMLESDTYTIAVQINGKLRANCEFDLAASEDEIKATVLKLANVEKHISGKQVKKVIIVPKKIINIVVI